MTKSGNTISVSVDNAAPTVIGTITSSRTTYSPDQFVSIGAYSKAYSASTLLPTGGYPSIITGSLNAAITDLFLFSRVLSPSELQQIGSRKAPLQPR